MSNKLYKISCLSVDTFVFMFSSRRVCHIWFIAGCRSVRGRSGLLPRGAGRVLCIWCCVRPVVGWGRGRNKDAGLLQLAINYGEDRKRSEPSGAE